MARSQGRLTIPDWLPNLSEAHKYPDTQTTTNEQWAWQFLRRNKDYQEYWHKFIAPLLDVNGKYDTYAADTRCITCRLVKINSSKDSIAVVSEGQ